MVFRAVTHLSIGLQVLVLLPCIVAIGVTSGGPQLVPLPMQRFLDDFQTTFFSSMNQLKNSIQNRRESFTWKQFLSSSGKNLKGGSKADQEWNTLCEDDFAFIDKLDQDNAEAYDLVMELQKKTCSVWKHVVTTSNGITVERCKMPTGSYVMDTDASAGAKHAGVKTTGVIRAPPAKIFNLFINNDRVKEYNEHIVKVRDVDGVIPAQKSESKKSKHWTKIAWSSSPKYGPLKARDFVSVVNFHERDDGSYVIINRPAYLSSYPVVKKYTRATVLLAGNIIEPHPQHAGWSMVTQVAHVNPGGLADSKLVAKMINALCAKGPPAFFAGLERAAKKM